MVDPETLQELPPGEVGEIITRGPMLFAGYWGHPEATVAAFVEFEGERFFRTGDLGRMDEEGYFFLTDRLKRMINASGFKVWPAEVESMLFRHPAVQEACIIAARDAYRGETVKAVVVLRAEARGKTSAEDIIAWAREQMAMRAPSAKKARAQARPMPLEPPVTTTTLPVTCIGCLPCFLNVLGRSTGPVDERWIAASSPAVTKVLRPYPNSRNSRRSTLPVAVIGSVSTNSMSLGVS